MPPVIALLTDFGLRDYYVAAMKGTILGICPDAALVDITHQIPPQDIAAGALELAACYRAFPPGAIFLAVVDPGVGSARRAIAAEGGGYRFVAPDNGLVALVLDEIQASLLSRAAPEAPNAPALRVVELNRPQYAAHLVSRTFEGRDRFAPAAAWLAAGVALDSLGDRIDAWTRLEMPQPSLSGDRVEGTVVRIDRFGNLVTNIPCVMVEQLRGPGGVPPRVSVGDGRSIPLVSTYSEVPAGAACALAGSTGHIEVSVNGGSAREQLDVARGAPVTVQCSA